MKLRAVVVLVLAAACAQPPEPRGYRASALDLAFRDSANEFGVPEPVLKAIGYAESRWDQRSGQASLDQGYGVMHLTDGTGGNTLYRAAALTGLSPQQLRTDAIANVRGGAAVLGAIADEQFAAYGDLDRGNLGDWWQAVMHYSAIEDPEVAEQYAQEVYETLERGAQRTFPDGEVRLSAQKANYERHRIFSRQVNALTDYPGPAQNGQAIHWIASPNYSSRSGSSITTVVIHDMEGSYSGSISWFQSSSSQVSAHYLVRSSDGDITHMVADANKAWHAQCYNPFSIGIEHEGYAAQGSQWYTEAMYQSSAALTRWECDKHGIAKDRSHIIGHAEIPSSCNTNNHTDPGPQWNWSHYMALVTGSTAQTGTLVGVVYSGSTSNRVAGAAVSLSGGPTSASTTADGSGYFTFNNVKVGSYTVNASASGYQNGSHTGVSVTANATVWGSVDLAPVQTSQTGSFDGTIFDASTGADASTATPISGATATLQDASGATLATQVVGSDGHFHFASVSTGNHAVLAHAAGYADNSATRTVAANATVTGDLGLQPSVAPQAPVITVSAPDEGSRTRENPVALAGKVTWTQGTVSDVSLSVNGGAATLVPLDGSGAFSTAVSLQAGPNVVAFSASDGTLMGELTLHVEFLSGADLTLVKQGDASPIASAEVHAFFEDGGIAASATSDATGRAVLDLAPGTWPLHIVAPGFLIHDESLTIADGPRSAETIPLTVDDGATTTPPGIFIDAPAANANLSGAQVAISGHLVGTRGVVREVTVDGVVAAVKQDDSVGAQADGANLGWSASFSLGDPDGGAGGLKLQPGANVITAKATLADGTTLSTTEQVTFVEDAPVPHDVKGKGCGCGETDGLSLIGLLLAGATLRARRRMA